MSERTFARAFRREVGIDPRRLRRGRCASSARGIALEDARRRVEAVARALRLRHASRRMRRAFHRRLGVGPAAYRSRFRPRAA